MPKRMVRSTMHRLWCLAVFHYPSRRMHELEALSDALAFQGVYTGGLAQANALVQSGQAQARDFKLLAVRRQPTQL